MRGGYHNRKHVSKEKGDESEARACGHAALHLRRNADRNTFPSFLDLRSFIRLRLAPHRISCPSHSSFGKTAPASTTKNPFSPGGRWHTQLSPSTPKTAPPPPPPPVSSLRAESRKLGGRGEGKRGWGGGQRGGVTPPLPRQAG